MSHALFAIRSFQDIDCSESSCLVSLLYSFAEGGVDQVEDFTVLGRERGTDGKLLPSKTLLEAVVAWLSDDYFRYCYARLVVLCYCFKGPSLQPNDLGAVDTFLEYYSDVDCKVDWDLTDLNAAEEPFEYTVLRTIYPEVEEACRRVDVAALSSVIDTVHLAPGHVSAVVAGDNSSNDALWRTAEVSELQIKYDRLEAQLSTITSECGTGRSLPRERGGDVINLRASRDAS